MLFFQRLSTIEILSSRTLLLAGGNLSLSGVLNFASRTVKGQGMSFFKLGF